MKGFLVLAACLASTLASAADLKLPYKAPVAESSGFNWTGLWVSGYGDYGVNFTDSLVSAGGVAANIGTAPHGPGLGGSLEGLYQYAGSAWVLGVRADMGWVNFSGSGSVTALGVPMGTTQTQTNYLGSVDAKIGYAFAPQFMGYAVGGFGFGGVKTALAGGGLAAATAQTSVGFNVGAGFEYAFTPNFAVFIEGDYFQLGGNSVTLPPGVTSAAQFNIAVQKAGASIKF